MPSETLDLFPEMHRPGPCPLCASPGYSRDCFYCDIRKRNHAPMTPQEKARAAESSRLYAAQAEARRAATAAWRERLSSLGRPVSVALVGCGKRKRDVRCAASEMYVGNLFQAAFAHARATADEVWILSAQHDVLSPEAVIDPYDATLQGRRKRERWAWGSRVGHWLLEHYAGLDVQAHLYAGELYAAPVSSVLSRWWEVWLPLEGLEVGERLAWFARERRAREAAGCVEPVVARAA